MTSAAPALPRPYRLDVHPRGCGAGDGIAADARAGLTAPRKWMPPKHFYDAEGSRLFDAITDLPEYYPTRTEVALLRSADEDAGVRAWLPFAVPFDVPSAVPFETHSSLPFTPSFALNKTLP